LVIVKDGQLAFERYGAGVTRAHNHAVYSVTKSITSTLIGMLVDDGRLQGARANVASRIAEYRPKLAGLSDKRELEIGHVLAMASGLRYAHDPAGHPIYFSRDRLTVALDAPFAARAGERFNYSDGDATIAGALVVATSGKSLEEFARQRLFEPLGMRNHGWPYADAHGLHPGGWALRLRAVDMAKFGQMVLDGGRWNGRQLVSRQWLDQATTRKVSPVYGYFWWVGLLGEDDVWAIGLKGQRIGILPRRRMVVALASVLPASQEREIVRTMFRDYIMPAVAGTARVPTTEQRQRLETELALAGRTPGEPRNVISPQDTPRLP
jgi:CubicO group peptidase (beta-lactamase class C family)